jgi:hypothetical protein
VKRGSEKNFIKLESEHVMCDEQKGIRSVLIAIHNGNVEHEILRAVDSNDSVRMCKGEAGAGTCRNFSCLIYIVVCVCAPASESN